MRARVPVLVVLAIVLDTVVGTARTGAPTAPVVTLAVVAGIALGAPGSVGAIAGFGAGVVLDLLAGPASPGGVHALVGLTVGSCVGAVRPRLLGPIGSGLLIGAPVVVVAAAGTMALQGLAASGPTLPVDIVALGALSGALACAMVVRFLRGPLPGAPRTA
jgi:rod shape-determining protein MreD